ncbi:MAG: hypothetical protein WCI73_20555, partial [Phycisphaerae bacterium]
TLVAALLLVSTGSFCFAGEQIDNPQYKSWAKYKPGTSVTVKTQTDMDGSQNEMETTTTLADLTAEKAVVETKMAVVAAGQKMEMPASKMVIPAKIDKPVADPADATNTPKADVKEGTEILEVAGQKIDCKWVQTKTTVGGKNGVSKVWTSDAVPTGMVKMDTNLEGDSKGSIKMMMTALVIK